MFEKQIDKVLMKLCPKCHPDYRYALLNNERYFSVFGINSEKRLTHFLTQIIHESGFLTRQYENLNYSEQGLVNTWPSRFGKGHLDPKLYAKNPGKIANVVYAGRMGNTEEGDGWKFRGRGMIQLTGKSMYQEIYKQMYSINNTIPDFTKDPDAVLNKEYCLCVTLIFWNLRRCNNYADTHNIRSITKAINGGYIGLEEREQLLEKINKIIKEV